MQSESVDGRGALAAAEPISVHGDERDDGEDASAAAGDMPALGDGPEDAVRAPEDAETGADAASDEADGLRDAVDALNGQLAAALDYVRMLLLNRDPDVPAELVHGQSVEELTASYERASGLVERLRQRAAERAAQERIPAGAPARRGPDTAALSPEQKILLGLRQAP